MDSQVTIPASAGGFSGVAVAIPAGTCCARVQPTLSDSDWSAGHVLTGSIGASLDGQIAPDAAGFVCQTGALQLNPSAPLPSFGGLNNPTPWPFDIAIISVACDDPTVEVGAIVSFADAPANLPAPALPPGYVPGTGGPT